MVRRLRILMAFWVVAASLLLSSVAVYAQAVAKAYKTDTSLQRGMIVKLADKDTNKVEAVTYDKMDKMEGVVVAANDAPVTITNSDQNTRQVFVASDGRYNVIVSNQNGIIKKDDYVTISALAGVGMKADGKQNRILGKALTAFDGKNNTIGQATVKNSQQKDIPITLGLVAVDVNIGHNPIEEKKDSLIPGLEFVQKAAGSVVNKNVSPGQLYIALIAMIVTAVISGSILYAGVRTSMIAIGRNPLAKQLVMRNLLQVVVTSVIILILGLVGVYLILKL